MIQMRFKSYFTRDLNTSEEDQRRVEPEDHDQGKMNLVLRSNLVLLMEIMIVLRLWEGSLPLFESIGIKKKIRESVRNISISRDIFYHAVLKPHVSACL